MSPHLGSTADIIVAALASSTLNATMILVVAFGVGGLWRRASAAQRHTVWFASLIAVGISVIASPLVPKVSIPFNASPAVASVAAALGVASRIDPQAAARTGAVSSRQSAGDAAAAPHVEMVSARPFLAVSEASTSVHVQTLVVSMWAVGLLILLVRLASGFLLVLRRGGRLQPIDDPTMLSELKSVESVLSARRAVGLVCGRAGSMPVAYGIRHSTVVLPANACDWTPDERRVVLLHEVAHVVRGDVVAQMLADAVCALLWFHPLIWLARQRLRAEAEGAADDVVLRAGICATRYADQLLAFARTNSATLFVAPATVGLFVNSDIERRLMAMLDTTRSRSSSSITMRNATACLACVVGAALATVRFVTPAAAAQVATGSTGSQPYAPLPVGARSRVTATGTVPAPDLSGTWTSDSAYAGYRMLDMKSVISIEQTADTIRIVRRGPMPDVVGRTGIQDVEFRLAVPLDGTAGTATLTYAGNTYDANVSGKWQNGTFITTIRGERLGFPWAERDSWSLYSNSSLALEAVASVTTYQDPSNSGYFEFTTSPTWKLKLGKRS